MVVATEMCYLPPKYSPTIVLLNPSVVSKNRAMSDGDELGMKPVPMRN